MPTDIPKKVNWRKVAKRTLIFGGSAFAILLVILLLLPVWMSNEQGRAYILARINKDLPGSLAVDYWSISWFRGMQIRGLSLTLPDGRKILDCPVVDSELTLGSILTGSYDFGNTRLPGAKLAITKYADGTTDITRLFPKASAPDGAFRKIRGAFNWSGGQLLIGSESSASALRLRDFSADLTIASPASTFFLRARGLTDSPTGPASQIVTCNAAFPPLSKWPLPLSEILPGVEFSGGSIPTSLVADWLNLGPGWNTALGDSLTILQFQNAGARPALGAWIPQLDVLGTNNRSIRAKLLLSQSPATPLLLLPPPTLATDNDFYCTATLEWSPPLQRLLRRVNPLFDHILTFSSNIHLRLDSFTIDLSRPTLHGSLVASLQLPTGSLAVNGIVREILHHEDTPPSPLDAIRSLSVKPFIVRLDSTTLSAEPLEMTLTLGNLRDDLRFTGTTDTNGSLALEVTRTRASSGLATLSARMPITGRIDKPQLTRP